MRAIVSNAARAVTKQIGMLKNTVSRLRAGDRLPASFPVKHIPVKNISVRSNIRKAYTRIDELAASIRRHGLLQPITVYREKGRYIVKTGHRRFLAYQTLCKEEPEQFHSIRCMVSTPENTDIIQLAENVQREDLSQTDLFNALSSMRDRGMTLKQIADAMGKTEGYIKNLFVGVNEITGNGELMALIDGHAGVTIQDIAETKGIADERERRNLLEQRKSGVINRAGMRKQVKELKAEKPATAIPAVQSAVTDFQQIHICIQAYPDMKEILIYPVKPESSDPIAMIKKDLQDFFKNSGGKYRLEKVLPDFHAKQKL